MAGGHFNATPLVYFFGILRRISLTGEKMDVAIVLKSEFIRLSKKIVRDEMASMRALLASQRKQSQLLKTRLDALEKRVTRVQKVTGKTELNNASAAVIKPRFDGDQLRALRERLDISQVELASLIGVSHNSIYNWETGGSQPREASLDALGKISKLGRREVRRRLSS